jgi:hypothetical protein
MFTGWSPCPDLDGVAVGAQATVVEITDSPSKLAPSARIAARPCRRAGLGCRLAKWPILNTILVGGPGFEPGALRSRTAAAACPRVSGWLREGPTELGCRLP